jgi:hypothetical protein
LSIVGYGRVRPLKASPSGGLRPALTGLDGWAAGLAFATAAGGPAVRRGHVVVAVRGLGATPARGGRRAVAGWPGGRALADHRLL